MTELSRIRKKVHDRMFASKEYEEQERELNGETDLALALNEEAGWLDGLLKDIEFAQLRERLMCNGSGDA